MRKIGTRTGKMLFEQPNPPVCTRSFRPRRSFGARSRMSAQNGHLIAAVTDSVSRSPIVVASLWKQ